jgi:hypothetical protein
MSHLAPFSFLLDSTPYPLYVPPMLKHNVQPGDIWRLNISPGIEATYLMLGQEGARWIVHHLEFDETTFFYDIWFSITHPDYDKWEKVS